MFFAFDSPLVDLESARSPLISSPRQDDCLDLRFDRCSFHVEGESRWGACDQIECGAKSNTLCASEECVNCPCESHAERCPVCRRDFCASSNRRFDTCFSEHMSNGKCQAQLLRLPLANLAQALDSPQYRDLDYFINQNSDGLGHPLPEEVCVNLGLAVAYSHNSITEYNRDVLIARSINKREQRRRQQKVRRAARKLGLEVPTRSCPSQRLAPHKNSTIHITTGALVVQHWTGRWHYREQMEILRIMGLHKSPDFVSDRINYLRDINPIVFKQIESYAISLSKRPSWR